MRFPNIFLVYIPPGNAEAMVNYDATIRQKVAPDRIYRHLSSPLKEGLRRIFGDRPITVWGSQDSPANRSKFDRMRPGDEILIVEGPTIKLLGKVAATTVNRELSRELWKPLRARDTTSWDLIYFIANPLQVDLPFAEFSRLMEYREEYQLRGLTTVSEDRLESFYDRYDDLYSVLMRIREGREIYERPAPKLFDEAPNEERGQPEGSSSVPAPPDEPSSDTLSDHLRMQRILADLGRKAGSQVWIPRSDQTRMRDARVTAGLETDFTAGLDTPPQFVEYIDVVWKEEFRIDAAFEVENSTAIYSGLLRFSDLTMVAPNTTYPLFVVAPRERRNQLVKQLSRPTFRRLDLDRKVRFLPYEAVEEIDRFFEGRERGLTAEAVVDRSEGIYCRP